MNKKTSHGLYKSAEDRNAAVLQYEPLINKLTSQFYHKVCGDWNTVKSMAYEGFTLAMNKFDPERSSMSFKSFAAFEMRNNIMTRLTEESRTVKIPFEEQKKMKESNISTFNTYSIDHRYNDDDGDINPRETVMGMYTSAKFEDGDVYECLYNRLEDKFPPRECEMFYYTFGLKNHKEMKNLDIAKHFKVSEGRVSQCKKHIIDFIKQDTDLLEMLASLMEH